MGDEGRIEPEAASSTTPSSLRHTHEGISLRATTTRRWWVAGSGAATVAAVTSSFPCGAFADEVDAATPAVVTPVEVAEAAPEPTKPPAPLPTASEDLFPDFEVQITRHVGAGYVVVVGWASFVCVMQMDVRSRINVVMLWETQNPGAVQDQTGHVEQIPRQGHGCGEREERRP